MGGRTGYGLMTGLFLFIAGLIGLFAFLQHLIPAAAIAPLLVFVGIVMTYYAFRATPPAALFSFFAFGLSLVGLIHAEQIGLSLSPITVAYLLLTLIFGFFHLVQPRRQALGEA